MTKYKLFSVRSTSGSYLPWRFDSVYGKGIFPVNQHFSQQPVDVRNQYTFKLWWDYTEICRHLADENNVDMRTLDRALWQYSKENQLANTAAKG